MTASDLRWSALLSAGEDRLGGPGGASSQEGEPWSTL
jgi:hypothetical protein